MKANAPPVTVFPKNRFVPEKVELVASVIAPV